MKKIMKIKKVKNKERLEMKLLIDSCFDFAKTTYNDWTDFSCELKLNEEYGELSEAILIEIGQITHKKNKEPVFGEIIDNLIMSLHFLSRKSLGDINFKVSNVKIKENLDYSIENVKNTFLKYKKLKDKLLLLNKKDSNKKVENLINKIIKELINLAIIFTNKLIKENSSSDTDKISNHIKELNYHLLLKTNKWKGIEEKRE